MLRAAKAARFRSYEQWAFDEIILSSGPFRNHRLRPHYQPFFALLAREMSSNRWRRFAITGCVQSGKTLSTWVGPASHALFELRKDVICGIPTQALAWKKFAQEMRPMILRTRYRDLLPTAGLGSRGGQFESVTFGNGATLTFMSGDLKQTKSLTAPIVIITEVNTIDQPSPVRTEADPITQMEARSLAFEDRARLYLEGVVTVPTGRISVEIAQGSASRLVKQCRACRQWVTPGRDHLMGHQEALSESQARASAYWQCPVCSAHWDDAERRAMIQEMKLVHRGQTIDENGTIHGPLPDTDTLGFRWNAFDNNFWSTGRIALEEWRVARRIENDLSADRGVRQYWWAEEVEGPELEEITVSASKLADRIVRIPRGVVPAWCRYLTIGVDVHRKHLDWVAIAWRQDGASHVVNYGVHETHWDAFSVSIEQGIVTGLDELAEVVLAGFAHEGQSTPRIPDAIWVDARYKGPEAVYPWMKKRADPKRFAPTLGYGAGSNDPRFRRYRPQTKLSLQVREIGPGYHVSWHPTHRLSVVEIDANHAKTFLHERLATHLEYAEEWKAAGQPLPPPTPGAMTVFLDSIRGHKGFFAQLTAERAHSEFIPGKGESTIWEVISHRNHALDAAAIASAAALKCGVRMVESQAPPPGPSGGWFQGRKRR